MSPTGAKRPDRQAKVAAWLVLVTVALAPLPLGSNQPVVIAFWCIVLGAAVVFAPVRDLSSGQLALIGLGILVIGAYGLVLHEQIAERPWLPGTIPHPIWRQVEQTLGGGSLVPVASVVRNQPWFELGRPLICVLAIACGLLIGVDERRARQLMKVIAWSGAVYATYGIISYLIDPTHLLWFEKEAYTESVTGTFINRNTAGAYFGSCATIWLLLLFERMRLEMPPGPLHWRDVPRRIFSSPSRQVVIASAMAFLCLAALFMSQSRAAIVLSMLALVVAFTLFFRRHLPGLAGVSVAIAGTVGVMVLLIQLMGAGVNARFDAQGLADEGRFETYKSTLRMIADRPWLGTGEGTFAYAYPAYRSDSVSMRGVWDRAHNTLLEIAAEMGVPIAALVAVAWLIVFLVLVRGATVRRGGRVLPVAALAVGLLAVLHSFVDFSLQIPGYSIVALSLIGAGLAQSLPNARSG